MYILSLALLVACGTSSGDPRQSGSGFDARTLLGISVNAGPGAQGVIPSYLMGAPGTTPTTETTTGTTGTTSTTTATGTGTGTTGTTGTGTGKGTGTTTTGTKTPPTGTGTTGTTPPCLDPVLGSAVGYNVYTLGDFTGINSDIAGRIAVGGTFDAVGYGLGSALPPGSGVVLSVGGDAVIANSQVYGGDAQVLGTCALANVGAPDGAITCEDPSTFDASATDLEMVAIEDWLSGLAEANCTVTAGANGSVSVVAAASPAVCHLDLDAAAAAFDASVLNGWVNGITVDAPAGTAIVVNVTGNTDRFGRNGAFWLAGGATAHDVLWGFGDAAYLYLNGVGLMGTVFAPHADLDFDNGAIDGQVIAASITGTGEFHDLGFTGDLCP